MQSASFRHASETLIRHAPATSINAVVVAVVETSFGTSLVTTAGLARATTANRDPARDVAVPVAPVASPAKEEDLPAFSAGDESKRVHVPSRDAAKLIRTAGSWDSSGAILRPIAEGSVRSTPGLLSLWCVRRYARPSPG